MIADDAARAYRAGVATTFVLSFAGGNFLAAAAVSPDGRYFAVPNGVITTVSSSDVRYVVQEIRIVTTETVPRILRRLPWRASFPVGTRFTSAGDIPRIRWVDSSALQFIDGTISEGQSPVQVQVLEDAPPVDAPGYSALSVSPDRTRALTLLGGRLVLLDLTATASIAALPQTPAGLLQVAWSPDSTQFAMTLAGDRAVSLALFSRDGEQRDTLVTLAEGQVLWNLRWSPDAARIAFTAFDPQPIENRLFVADLAARSVNDTCLPLFADVDGQSLSALAWSPDGSRLALVTSQTAARPQIQIYDVALRSRYNLVPAAGRLLGWYP